MVLPLLGMGAMSGLSGVGAGAAAGGEIGRAHV